PLPPSPLLTHLSAVFALGVTNIMQVFFRAALAILKLSESKLLELDLESIMTYLGRFPGEGVSVLDKDVLAPLALSIKVTGAGAGTEI
ncbi:unnamed protein product, partial [Laminaria digitata]